MTLTDYLASIIRTGVAVAMGAVTSWAVRHGLNVTGLAATVTPLAIFVYYAAIRWLEQRWPKLGTLLGLPIQPTYSTATGTPAVGSVSQPVVRILGEAVEEGRRLGRHIEHDARSLAYRARDLITPSAPVTTKLWPFPGKPLNQHALGSCTGNAAVHLLRVHDSKTAGLTEKTAVQVYERATQIDSVPGAYPPDDTGSTGLAALKAAQQLGLYTGTYRWCFGLDDVLAVLSQHGPVIVGVLWYSGFDTPSADGTIAISGQVRGGHEVCLIGVNAENKTVQAVNSWGSAWGNHGHFQMTWDTLDRLLKQQGDAATIG